MQKETHQSGRFSFLEELVAEQKHVITPVAISKNKDIPKEDSKDQADSSQSKDKENPIQKNDKQGIENVDRKSSTRGTMDTEPDNTQIIELNQDKQKEKKEIPKAAPKKRTRLESIENDQENEELQQDKKKQRIENPINVISDQLTSQLKDQTKLAKIMLSNTEIAEYIDSKIFSQSLDLNENIKNHELSKRIQKFVDEISEEHKLITEGHQLINEKIYNFLANLRNEVTYDIISSKNKQQNNDIQRSQKNDILGLFNQPTNNNIQKKQKKGKQSLPKSSIQKAPKSRVQPNKSDFSEDNSKNKTSLIWINLVMKCPLSAVKVRSLVKKAHNLDMLKEFSDDQILLMISDPTLKEQQGMNEDQRWKHLLKQEQFSNFSGKFQSGIIEYIYKYFQIIE